MLKNSCPISRLREALAYDPHTGVFIWLIKSGRCSIGRIAGSDDGTGYKQIRLDGKKYRAHRLAVAIMSGEFPDGEVDHINGNRSDNRWENLRVVNASANNQNRTVLNKNSTSGIRGVSFNKRRQKWEAHIKPGRRKISVGMFDSVEQATLARVDAARVHFPYSKECN